MNSSQPALFRELLTDQRWLVSISRRLLARGDDAEDIAQEASVRALEARAGRRVVPAGEARPWLIQTVRRLAWNANRREAVRASVPLEDRLEEQLDLAQAAPVDALARAEFRKVVAGLVMDLPEVEKETLVLRFYEDLSTAEIMEATGAPSKDAVRQRLSRGIRRLRDQLDSRGDEADWRHAAFTISGAASVKGGASSSATALLALLALGSVAIGGWWWQTSDDGGARPDVSALAAERTVALADLGDIRRDGRSSAAARVVAGGVDGAEIEGAPRGEVAVAIQDGATGNPVAGQPWFVIRTGEHDYGRAWTFSGEHTNPEPIAAGVTGADGALHFDPQGETLLNLCTERTDTHARGSWAIRVSDGVAEPGAVSLLVGTTFTGRVVDDLGEGCAGLIVAGRDYSNEWRQLATTDSDGGFTVPRCADFPRSFVIREDDEVEATRRLRTDLAFVPAGGLERLAEDSRAGVHGKWVARGRRLVAVEDVVFPRAVTIQGRVLGSGGRAAAGATVALGREPGVTADANGRYSLSLQAPRAGEVAVELRAASPGGGEGRLEVTGLAPGAILTGKDLWLDGLQALEVRWVSAGIEALDWAEESTLAKIRWDAPSKPQQSLGPTEWVATILPTPSGGKIAVPGAQLPDRTSSPGALRGTLVVPGWAPASFLAPLGAREVVVALEPLPRAHIELNVTGAGAESFEYAKVTITAQPPPAGLSPYEVARRLAAAPGTGTVAHAWENGERRALPLAAGSGFYAYVTLFSGTARAPRVLAARGPIALADATAEAPFELDVVLARWPERQRLDQAAFESDASVAVSARRPSIITARVVDGVTGELIDDALMRSVDTRHQHRSFQRPWKGEGRRLQLECSLDQITLRLMSHGYEPLDIGPIALVPGEEVELGDVALWSLSPVPCRLVEPGGKPLLGIRRVRWNDPVAGWAHAFTDESGEAEIFTGVEPVRYAVVGDVQGSSAPPQRVRTRWNEAGECTLVVQPWRQVRLRIQGLELRWRTGVGEVLVEAQGASAHDRHRRATFTSPRMEGEDVIFDMSLPPGTWVVRPAAPEFVSFPEVEVTVPRASAGSPLEVATRAQLGSGVAR
jgi:RNA polymerase sigma-70 factor (ECF subfamily)